MTTRVGMAIVAIIAIAIAWRNQNLAAGYVAAFGYGIMYLLHAIEFKINKLLDDRGITVWDDDIARD